MANSTLQQTDQQPNFALVATKCGTRVVGIAAAGVGLLGLLGKLLEQREAVWSATVWALTLGGHFWGCIAVGGTALCVLAWVACIDDHLPDKDKTRTGWIWVKVITIVLWFLESIVLQWVFSSFSDLTIYQAIAVVCMYQPYWIVLKGIKRYD